MHRKLKLVGDETTVGTDLTDAPSGENLFCRHDVFEGDQLETCEPKTR
jgi:hypothetical protein